MVTSQQILERTGLKSAKTLTRWHQRGLIPEPMVRTHPSGRGKMAYWPDWVLDRCVRIVDLQRQGHSLQSAALTLSVEQIGRNLEYATRVAPVWNLLDDKDIKLPDGRSIKLDDVLLARVRLDIKPLMGDQTLVSSLIAKMREARSTRLALQLLHGGYNPVLLFDGGDVDIIPDFVVSDRLSDETATTRSYVVLPLLASLRAAFKALGKELPFKPNATPAPKIWTRDGDALIEYMYYPGGSLGFELIRETAKVIGTSPGNAEGADEQ